MKYKLDEKDLEQLFITRRYRRRNPLLVFLSFAGLFVLIFLVVTYLLNFGAYNKKIAWWWQDEFGTSPHILVDSVKKYQNNQVEKNSDPEFPNISDNSIYIESIKLNAPISFGIENNESAVASNLKNGVIQISGTSLPGETGNVFITGHSSNYPWVRSKYNSVFALLGNVVVGDLLQIKFHDTIYIYQVSKNFVVAPSDVSVMNSNDSKSTLTLMTCTPLGTNLKRLIVQADQIIPSPSYNKPTTNKNIGVVPDSVH